MGVVYRAADTLLHDRVVAVKVMAAHLSAEPAYRAALPARGRRSPRRSATRTSSRSTPRARPTACSISPWPGSTGPIAARDRRRSRSRRAISLVSSGRPRDRRAARGRHRPRRHQAVQHPRPPRGPRLPGRLRRRAPQRVRRRPHERAVRRDPGLRGAGDRPRCPNPAERPLRARVRRLRAADGRAAVRQRRSRACWPPATPPRRARSCPTSRRTSRSSTMWWRAPSPATRRSATRQARSSPGRWRAPSAP